MGGGKNKKIDFLVGLGGVGGEICLKNAKFQ